MNSLRRLGLLLLTLLALVTVARPVRAADSEEEGEKSTKLPIDPRSTERPGGALFRGWHPRPARWFISGRADVGFLFFRPRASAGYGKPHEHWAGLDVVPILSSTQFGVYSGLRYRHPRFEIRSGGLLSFGFQRSYLDAADSFDARDLEIQGDDEAAFVASDSEVTFSIPVHSFLIGAETQALVLFGVPEDKYVFVNTVGAVVAPPLAFRQRVSVGHAIPGVPGFFFAPAGEVVFVPERSDPWVVRAGGILGFAMYQDLDISTAVLPTVKSPDTLGRTGAPWFRINVRVRWATN